MTFNEVPLTSSLITEDKSRWVTTNFKSHRDPRGLRTPRRPTPSTDPRPLKTSRGQKSTTTPSKPNSTGPKDSSQTTLPCQSWESGRSPQNTPSPFSPRLPVRLISWEGLGQQRWTWVGVLPWALWTSGADWWSGPGVL